MPCRYDGLRRFEQLKKIIYTLVEVLLIGDYHDIAVSAVFALYSERKGNIGLKSVQIMLISDDPCTAGASCGHDGSVGSGNTLAYIAAELYILLRQLVLELFIAIAAENIKIFVQIQKHGVIGRKRIRNSLIILGRALAHESDMTRDMIFTPFTVGLRHLGQSLRVHIKSVSFAHVS